jgi:hypothetical protein
VSPEPRFIRMLIVKTIADVTGDDAADIARASQIELDARDWEQVVSRLEALFDCTLDLLGQHRHLLDIASVGAEIARRAAFAGPPP